MATLPDMDTVRPGFRALATAIVPRAADLSEDEWWDVEAIVQDALVQRPVAVRRQLILFIRLADLLPALRWGRPFRRLDPARRARFLTGLERSRLFLLRRGFWGLRTLVFMGYYGRPEAAVVMGYGARLRGWLEHPDAPAAARQRVRGEAGADGGPGVRREGRP